MQKRVPLYVLVCMCVCTFLLGMNIRRPSSAVTTTTSDSPSSTRSGASSLAPPQHCPPSIHQKNQHQNDEMVTDESEGTTTTSNAGTQSPLHLASSSECLDSTRRKYEAYAAFSTEGTVLRNKYGPLHIIAFSRLWPPPFHGTGGMQYHALHLYSQLAAHGHTIHVIITGGHHQQPRSVAYAVDKTTLKLTPHHNNDADADSNGGGANLVIHQVPSERNGEYSEIYFNNALDKFVELNKTVNKGKGFDVAHSESWAGVPLAYQVGLQMAITWHGSMLDWFRNEVNLIVHNFRIKGKMVGAHTVQRMKELGSSVAFEAYMLLAVPHHIVISDSAAKDLKEINLVDAERIHLIYNGVNPTNFRPDPHARAAFLRQHNVAHDSFVIGCGGRLDAIKGHLQLSRAVEILLTKHKGGSMTLFVAGSGGEGEKYQALKAKGLAVVMLGMLPQQKLAEFYQSIDVFVDPFYQHHGLNTVMIEAALCGTPVIATNLASAQTTVPCDDFGLKFPLGEISHLVKQVEFLCDHPEKAKQMGKNSRARALALFTSTAMAGSYETLFYKAAFVSPLPLLPLTGKIVCKHTYPAMCYREPS